ncbi:MAG: hypothetical protein AAF687_07555 [Pseudomonadota bacterium]
MTGQTSDLETRIKELEDQLEKSAKPSFWAFDTWQDSIKSISMPIALILAGLALWNNVILGFFGRDEASIEELRSNIDAIQSMDQEIYVLNQKGADQESAAMEAAVVAKRDRLVAETFDHWRRNPDYFRPSELQILINHLILQYRTTDALAVFQEYWPTRQSPAHRAEGKLLEARIYSRGGDLEDVDKADNALRQATEFSGQIPNLSDRAAMQSQLLYKKGLIEIENKSNCDLGEQIVATLDELAGQYKATVIEQTAADLQGRFEQICSG